MSRHAPRVTCSPGEISSPESLPQRLRRCPKAWSGLLSQRSADRSARHMENGICSLGLVGKCLDSFLRGQNQQSDFSAARFEFHLVHHRKRSISSRANHEALAIPGYLFLDRDRGMSELLAKSFRGLLLALANPASVNDDVTFIGNAINFDFTEVKFAEVHDGNPCFTLRAIHFLFEPFP